jgi:hypothetical protein
MANFGPARAQEAAQDSGKREELVGGEEEEEEGEKSKACFCFPSCAAVPAGQGNE